jgi:type I restriction enzyme, R subunit
MLNPDKQDITGVLGDISKLLAASIGSVDMPAQLAPVMGLPKIYFGMRVAKFKESKHKNPNLEVFKAAVRAELEKLIRLN